MCYVSQARGRLVHVRGDENKNPWTGIDSFHLMALPFLPRRRLLAYHRLTSAPHFTSHGALRIICSSSVSARDCSKNYD